MNLNYVDLKINGKLFPTWILANFKQYKLPERLQTSELTDKCNIPETERELHKYQQFVSKYMDFNSPYRDILLYHGLGSGKTGTAINIYNVLYNYTPGWNVYVLIKHALKGTWLDEIQKWLKKDEFEYRYKNIMFINYDSPVADKQFMTTIKNSDSSKKSIYIIEEVHNFIRNVASNINTGEGKRALTIYDHIIQDKTDNIDTRVILLSGTPAINKPFELALLFNLLRPGIFTKSESEFNQYFVSDTTYQTINPNTINMFQRRIMGLVSYYYGSTKEYVASKTVDYVDVEMSKYQEEIYDYYEEIEKNMEKRGTNSKVYKSYTRQVSNFVFPNISQRVTGENRPRPSKFRITMRDAEKLETGKLETNKLIVNKEQEFVTNINEYRNALTTYIREFIEFLDKHQDQDQKINHTIMDDVKNFISLNCSFREFRYNSVKKSSLFEAMLNSSAKMLNIIFNISLSKGPVLVYSNYVQMEGLELFKIYLSYFNYYSWMKDKKLVAGKIGYTEYHGGIKELEDRRAAMKAFNEINNKYGDHIKIMLVSPAGSEGLSLENVRQVHIMEPYWNEVRIQQMIGRGIRYCSHKNLPVKERHVDVYRYKSVKSNTDSWTTDQHIEDLARSKEGLIQSFLDAMKEVSVDCVLNQNDNMVNEKYKCFQFEEKSLFDENIGPAYKQYLLDDIKNNNGSNSTNAMSMKIKVMKINAVYLLSKPDDESKNYSKSEEFWYYEKSGIVYDKVMHYPVGRVGYDDEGVPLKLDKNTYIIYYRIPIPIIHE